MIDPQAYMIQGNPMQGVTQGLGSGLQIGMALRDRQDARAAAEDQKLQQMQLQQELNDLSQAPTQEKMTSFMIRNPAMAEKLKTGWDSMTETQHKVATNTSIEALSALGSNNPAVAKQAIEKRALAFENAGDIQQANAYKAIASQIDFDPNGAKTSLMMIASQGAKPDQMASIFATLGKEGREQQLQPYEVAQAGANVNKTRADTGLTSQQLLTERQNTAIKQAEADVAPSTFALRNEQVGAQIEKIRADQRLGMLNYELNSEKLDADLEWRYEELERKGTALDGAGQKMVNDAVLESTTLATMAQQQKDLATKARNSGQSGGLLTSGWEGVKNAMGIETERSDMVKEVTKMINSEVIKNLPPGPATDKDVDIIRKGFPPATADGETIARFLDSMSKVNMAAAANKQMQAEWQSQNGNLGNSKRDLDVLGIQVPRGMTYQKFASSNMGKAINQIEQNSSQQAISRGTASYLKYGQ